MKAVRALELEAPANNMILRQCDYLLPPSKHKIVLIAERFEDTWTKLRVFELVDYDIVCYVDADMAIFGDMDSVFDSAVHLPEGRLAATHACVCNLDADAWAPKDWTKENCAFTAVSHPQALTEPTQPAAGSPETHHLLNGGMFLFKPKKELWEEMLTFFLTTPLLPTFQFPDQDFLAHFFRGKWQALGWQYNALKTMQYWHKNIWRDESVICLHYIVDKPWTRRVDGDGVAGYKGQDGTTHQWWWKCYNAWEVDRLLKGKGISDAVALIRPYVVPPQGLTVMGWTWDEGDADMKAIGCSVQRFANNKSSDDLTS
jgi:inositol 3-alpha-galactosyltransferase